MDNQSSKRILAIDILRGITIAGMILVNNPGSWGHIYAPLEHAEWIGLTPTDLVFPFFMFIMGISMYISLGKYNFECNGSSLWKIFKRSFVIFFIGLFINWFSLCFRTYHALATENLDLGQRLLQAITNFENLRILGVMQRLALSYCAASVIAVCVKHKYIPYLIAVAFIGYFILLLSGDGFVLSEQNILAIIDNKILGISHTYMDGDIHLDPEGLMSTIPAIAHVLIGFCAGKLLLSNKGNKNEQAQILFIFGAILTFSGFLLSYGCPISKKIWTPTFALVTCGLASTLLALLIWVVDVKGKKKWSVFFESFGVNPLFTYVVGGIISILLNGIYIGGTEETTKSIKSHIYTDGLQPILGDLLGSLSYALLYVGLIWLIGNYLYKKQIYIKI